MSLRRFMDALFHGPIVGSDDGRRGFQCRLVSQGARFASVDVLAIPLPLGRWVIHDVRWRGTSILSALSGDDFNYLHRELEKHR